MWLTLLELLHRLSIESLFEKVDLKQVRISFSYSIWVTNLSIELLDERSEAYCPPSSRRNDCRFLLPRDIPLHSISSNQNFSALTGRIYLTHGWTLRLLHHLACPNFSAAEKKIWRRVRSEENWDFGGFRGKRLYSWVLSLQ